MHRITHVTYVMYIIGQFKFRNWLSYNFILCYDTFLRFERKKDFFTTIDITILTIYILFCALCETYIYTYTRTVSIYIFKFVSHFTTDIVIIVVSYYGTNEILKYFLDI